MLSATERLGVGLSAALLVSAGMTGCGKTPQEQPPVPPAPEVTTLPPTDEDTVKTVGGVVVAIYDKRHPEEQYPAYSTPKGKDQTGSYARGEEVDIVCSAAKRYLLHDPDEWLDTRAVKISGNAKVPRCTSDQIPEEYTPEPPTMPDSRQSSKNTQYISETPSARVTPSNPCGIRWGYNPITKKYDHSFRCY